MVKQAQVSIVILMTTQQIIPPHCNCLPMWHRTMYLLYNTLIILWLDKINYHTDKFLYAC